MGSYSVCGALRRVACEQARLSGQGKSEENNVYARLALLGDLFSRFFPTAEPVHRFSGCMISRAWYNAWYRLHVFPRLAPAASFPALGTGYIFSRRRAR